jgi:DNA-binding CsgD family transcriptional regulator
MTRACWAVSDSPWPLLTLGQERVLDKLIELGDNKLIARALSVELKTVENHLTNAYTALGLKGAGSRVLAAIRWHEYRKGQRLKDGTSEG